jgi:hypothetical protein
MNYPHKLQKSHKNLSLLQRPTKSLGSSDGNETGYGWDDQGSGVRLPVGAGNFSVLHHVQTGSWAHPASYPKGTRGSFSGVKRPGREGDHSPQSNAEVKNAWH